MEVRVFDRLVPGSSWRIAWMPICLLPLGIGLIGYGLVSSNSRGVEVGLVFTAACLALIAALRALDWASVTQIVLTDDMVVLRSRFRERVIPWDQLWVVERAQVGRSIALTWRRTDGSVIESPSYFDVPSLFAEIEQRWAHVVLLG